MTTQEVPTSSWPVFWLVFIEAEEGKLTELTKHDDRGHAEAEAARFAHSSSAKVYVLEAIAFYQVGAVERHSLGVAPGSNLFIFKNEGEAP